MVSQLPPFVVRSDSREERPMDIKTEHVILDVTDGTSMNAYVARPSAEVPARGLIVCQEAFGVNTHIRDITERFARQGYFAIAPELLHRTAQNLEVQYDDFETARPHIQALTDPELETDLRAVYGCLRANGLGQNSPISAIGFCMGGRVAFLAGLSLPINAAVSFYGGGIAPNERNPGLLMRVKELRAPVLLVWGGKDKHVNAAQARAATDALRDARKSYVSVEFADADHGFFCDARPSYHAASAVQAWQLALAFLDTNATRRDQARTARA
jgi:carboxymethylenebutenolidase